MGKVLLVQPRFPVPSKSLHHKNYLPVGLLKLGRWYRERGHEVALSLGDLRTDFVPDEICVTSVFTYWAGHVREAVQHYRLHFPKARIVVGGIYASLQPEHCEQFTGCDAVWRGVHPAAEACGPDYSLVDSTFQIVHASRGCVRRCAFCGTYKIEPTFAPKTTIRDEIVRNHVVFYDNNLLANPHITDLLRELAAVRVGGRVVTCESQSGFDGRILLRNPSLATMLKKAHFRNPRIAWDGDLDENVSIACQLELLHAAGFAPRDVQVFMLYNHEQPPETLYAKVEECFQRGVQVADCRYRPLDLFQDGYRPYKAAQAAGEYYIHRGWRDEDVRGLRSVVRANNICLRYRIPRGRYEKSLERFRRTEKRDTAARLGIENDCHTPAELDAINLEWSQTRRGSQAGKSGQATLPCETAV